MNVFWTRQVLSMKWYLSSSDRAVQAPIYTIRQKGIRKTTAWFIGSYQCYIGFIHLVPFSCYGKSYSACEGALSSLGKLPWRCLSLGSETNFQQKACVANWQWGIWKSWVFASQGGSNKEILSTCLIRWVGASVFGVWLKLRIKKT